MSSVVQQMWQSHATVVHATRCLAVSIAELLLEHGATAESYNRRHLTPLHYAQSNTMTRLLTDFASQQLVLRQQRQQYKRSDSSTSITISHVSVISEL